MSKPLAYIVEILLILQWGIVLFIGHAKEESLPNSLYMISFLLFWAGLASLIYSIFLTVLSKKR
jgi:hypothetical protein